MLLPKLKRRRIRPLPRFGFAESNRCGASGIPDVRRLAAASRGRPHGAGPGAARSGARKEEEMDELSRIEDATIARMIRELQSDLADLVEAGEMTAEEANEWVNHKADQWSGGLS